MTLGTLYSDGFLCPFTHRVLIAAGEMAAPIDLVYDKDIPVAVRDQVPAGGWPVFVTAGGGEMLYAVEPDSEQWRLLLTEMHRYLSAEQWLRIARRFEDALPTSLMVVPSDHRRGTIGSAARALHAAAPVDRIEIPRA